MSLPDYEQLGAFYLGKSLRVAVSPEGVVSRRFLFGYPITTRRLQAADVRAFSVVEAGSMSSGKKTTVYYQLHATGPEGKKVPVAERLAGRTEAELLKETYETYLGNPVTRA